MTWHIVFVLVTVLGIYFLLTIVSHIWQERNLRRVRGDKALEPSRTP